MFLFNTELKIKEAISILQSDLARDPKSGVVYVVIRKEISKDRVDGFVPLNKQALEQIGIMRA